MYEYLKLGQVFGPLSAAELLELAEAGEVDPEDRVRALGDLGDRPAAEVIAVLRTARLAQESVPAPRLTRSSRPAVGGQTVFGSVRPLPPNPVPQIDITAPAARCTHAGNPEDARYCGTCGAPLLR